MADDDFDDFTAQLNNQDEGEVDQNEEGYEGVTQAQKEAVKKMQEAMDKEPLRLDTLKGKVDVQWYGHAGFKIYFKDKNDVNKSIYIDIWIDNEDCPPELKEDIPNDADLVLITHGQPDHSTHGHFLAGLSKRPDRKIVCNKEISIYMQAQRQLPPELFFCMQRGGTKDFGFCKITMVAADHPSSYVGPDSSMLFGGQSCGFVITIPDHNVAIYHMGDTNIFSDMKLIDELYKPSVVMIPVGDCLGMGPREAAYAAKNFLPTVQTFIPMPFNSFKSCMGTPEAFEKECKDAGLDESKKIVHPKNFKGGYSLVPN